MTVKLTIFRCFRKESLTIEPYCATGNVFVRIVELPILWIVMQMPIKCTLPEVLELGSANTRTDCMPHNLIRVNPNF